MVSRADHQPRELLQVVGISHAFGGIHAVDDCTFDVQQGSITALIGPNGAGKTTAVNLIAGALQCRRGSIVFDGTDCTGWPSYRVARLGIMRTFQISRELGNLTTLENLLVVVPDQKGESVFNALCRPAVSRSEDKQNVPRALEVLETFGLYVLRNEYARNLSGGQKRLLELARAVMSRPRMLLLDEPMASINPSLVDRISEHILELRKQGLTLLMVEHNLGAVEQLCDHVVVMAEGRTLARGTMAELRANEEVVRAYLGTNRVVERARS